MTRGRRLVIACALVTGLSAPAAAGATSEPAPTIPHSTVPIAPSKPTSTTSVASSSVPVTLPPTDPPPTLPPTDDPGTTTTSPTTALTPLPVIPAEAWARFDEILNDRLVGRGDRAAGVAVSVDGQLIHAAAFGVRAPGEPLDPATTTDRFRIASVSKLVTAVVVLQLVADGRLELDAPVGDLLSAATGVPLGSDEWRAVTVRQLLSHTGAVPKYRGEFFGGTFATCEGAAAYGLSHRLSGTPGTAHVYSNLDFCLLGLLIQHVTGVPYQQAVTDLLLTPLGITGMRTVATIDPNPDEVVHVDQSGRTYMDALGGAGAWVATPSDLVRILDSLDPATPGWHPLPAELATLMRQPIADVSYPDPWARTYGLGTIVWPDGSYGHTGTVERTHAMLARRPDGVTWSILIAGEVPEDTESLRDVFQAALDGAGIELSTTPQHPPLVTVAGIIR